MNIQRKTIMVGRNKNIQGSHSEQTKQNQKQPRANHELPNKTDGNPRNQNNQRQPHYSEQQTP
jgi:hypothetical protein